MLNIETIKEALPALFTTKSSLMTAIYAQLELKFGTVNQEEGSNISALVEAISEELLRQNSATALAYAAVVEFFSALGRSELAISSSSLYGLRHVMLTISGVADFKQYVSKVQFTTDEGALIECTKAVETVVRLDDTLVDADDEAAKLLVYQQIGAMLVNHLDVGTRCTALSDDAEAVTVRVNGCNGQEVSYSFSLAKAIALEMSIEAEIDYSQTTPYDLSGKIAAAFSAIVAQNYTNNIGKSFYVQDFYAITSTVLGLKSLSLSWVNSNNTASIFADGKDHDETISQAYFLQLSLPLKNIRLIGV